MDQENQQPRKKSSLLRILGKVLSWLLILVFVSAIAGLLYLDHRLSSDKTKVLDQLPFLDNGSITFDKADISLFENFPAATVSLRNVVVHDSLYQQHQTPLLQVGTLSAALDIGRLLRDSVEIKAIGLEQGIINLFTDSTGYNNLKAILKEKKGKGNGRDNKKKFKLLTDGIKLNLSDIEVLFANAIKTSRIHGTVKQLKTQLHEIEGGWNADVDMNIDISELTFKKRKGSFVSNSTISGKLKTSLQDGHVSIDPFDLHINEQTFLFTGDIQPGAISTLSLKNKKTQYDRAMPLLPEQLQDKIKPFKVDGSFYTKTIIKGTFRNGDDPIVDIHFKLNGNPVTALKVDLEDVQLDGRFVNRIYTDERQWTEGKQRIRFEINELKAKHSGFQLSTKNALLTSTQPEGLRIKAKTDIYGDAAGISDWFENDQFFFESGKFHLYADLEGRTKTFNELLIDSYATLDLDEFAVWYQPGQVSFPFKKLELKKDAGDATFSIVNSSFVEGAPVVIDGGLENLPALVFDLSDEQASSELNWVSSKLSWTDFINLFGENGYLKKKKKAKTDQEKKKSMKETISGIYYNFQPRISIQVDTLSYYDLIELANFKTGIHFKDQHQLVLEKTQFKYGEGEVDFSGQLDISDSLQTPFELELNAVNINLQQLLPKLNYLNIQLLERMESHAEDVNVYIRHKGILNDQKGLVPNSSSGEIRFESKRSKNLKGRITYEPTPGRDALVTHVELEGGPELFNQFFKTEQFIFSEGRFYATLDYTGDIRTKDEIFEKAVTSFSMRDAYINYKLVDVNFPFKRVDLSLQGDQADFNFFIRSDKMDRQISFDGKIENLSEMIIGNTGKALHVDININSPIVAWKDFLDIFAPDKSTTEFKKEKVQKEVNSVDKMKASVHGMLKTFDPTITVQIDTFIYSKQLQINQLETGFHLRDSNYLVLDHTDFNFHDGTMHLDGEINLGEKDRAPFQANFNSQDLDVARLLKSLDYLNLPTLQSIEELAGRVTMNLDIEGTIADDAKGLVPEDTHAVLDFELTEVELSGFPALDTIAQKVRMQERFQLLRFAPISNRITMVGTEVDIPLMEIQSNAIDLFVEGNVSYVNNTNLWISIPLKNIEKRDFTIIPEKQGYAATRSKVHVEIIPDEAGINQFKFQLRKKKFYRDRGIPKQYWKDRRRFWKERRAMKRRARRGND